MKMTLLGTTFILILFNLSKLIKLSDYKSYEQEELKSKLIN